MITTKENRKTKEIINYTLLQLSLLKPIPPQPIKAQVVTNTTFKVDKVLSMMLQNDDNNSFRISCDVYYLNNYNALY